MHGAAPRTCTSTAKRARPLPARPAEATSGALPTPSRRAHLTAGAAPGPAPGLPARAAAGSPLAPPSSSRPLPPAQLDARYLRGGARHARPPGVVRRLGGGSGQQQAVGMSQAGRIRRTSKASEAARAAPPPPLTQPALRTGVRRRQLLWSTADAPCGRPRGRQSPKALLRAKTRAGRGAHFGLGRQRDASAAHTASRSCPRQKRACVPHCNRTQEPRSPSFLRPAAPASADSGCRCFRASSSSPSAPLAWARARVWRCDDVGVRWCVGCSSFRYPIGGAFARGRRQVGRVVLRGVGVLVVVKGERGSCLGGQAGKGAKSLGHKLGPRGLLHPFVCPAQAARTTSGRPHRAQRAWPFFFSRQGAPPRKADDALLLWRYSSGCQGPMCTPVRAQPCSCSSPAPPPPECATMHCVLSVLLPPARPAHTTIRS